MPALRSGVVAMFSLTLFAQDNAINVIASRTVDLPPEEVTFSVSLSVDQATTLEQAVELLKDTGITEKNLYGVQYQPYGPSPNQARIAYQFMLAVPYAKYKETMDKLQTARRLLAIDAPTADLQIMLAQIGTTEASREQARIRVLPDLIADARVKGEQLAKAAGITLGPIVGLTDNTGSAYIGGYPYFIPGPTRVTYTLAVRFAVR